MSEKKNEKRREQENATEKQRETDDYQRGRRAAFGLNGARVDVARGFAALKAAADAGNVEAQADAAELIFIGGLGRKSDLRQAVEWASASAEAGNPFAFQTLGNAYWKGLGVPRNEALAEAYFRRAVVGFKERTDDPRAETKLALLLIGGRGVERSFDEAIRLLRKAGDAGAVEAKTALAWRYYWGEGVERSVDEAARLFREAADAGATDAATALAELSALDERGEAKCSKKRAETTRLFRKAAMLGSVEAAERLAKRLFLGVGTSRDVAAATVWFRRAAEAGSVEAAKRLAIDCEIDGEERVARLSEAVETANDPEAMTELGRRWQEGEDTPWSSNVEATRLFERAARLGWAPAMRCLGEQKLGDWNEEETEEFGDFKAETNNVDGALAWLERAVERGDGKAANRLGIIYQNGQYGVRRDASTAARWFELGGEFGDGRAANSAGVAWLNGKGVEKNETKAVEFFELAWRLGDADGANNLGLAYDEGWGNKKKDCEKAERLFRQAIERGNASACLNLGARLKDSDCFEKRQEGRRFLEMARKAGEPFATFCLAQSYLRSCNPERDVELGLALLREAIEMGVEEAKDELARRGLDKE